MSNLLVYLAKALDEAGIPYMVIGGQAVLTYIRARLQAFEATLSQPLVAPFDQLLQEESHDP